MCYIVCQTVAGTKSEAMRSYTLSIVVVPQWVPPPWVRTRRWAAVRASITAIKSYDDRVGVVSIRHLWRASIGALILAQPVNRLHVSMPGGIGGFIALIFDLPDFQQIAI